MADAKDEKDEKKSPGPTDIATGIASMVTKATVNTAIEKAPGLVEKGASKIGTKLAEKAGKEGGKQAVKGATKVASKAAFGVGKVAPAIGMIPTGVQLGADINKIAARADDATKGDPESQKAAIESFVNVFGTVVGGVAGGVVVGVAGAGTGAGEGAAVGAVGAGVGAAPGAGVGAVAQGVVGVALGVGEGAGWGQFVASLVSPIIAEVAQPFADPAFRLAGSGLNKVKEYTGINPLEHISGIGKITEPIMDIASNPVGAVLDPVFKVIGDKTNQIISPEGLSAINPKKIESTLKNFFEKDNKEAGVGLAKFFDKNGGAPALSSAFDKLFPAKKEALVFSGSSKSKGPEQPKVENEAPKPPSKGTKP